MFIVYNLATGAAHSLGSVVADPLPDGCGVVDVGDASFSTHEWDAATLSMVPRGPRVVVTLSRGDFMMRLGFTREATLHAVRLNAATPIETRAQLETMYGWLGRVTEVNVTHPATIAGVQLMAGVLASLGQLPEGDAAFTAAMLMPVEGAA